MTCSEQMLEIPGMTLAARVHGPAEGIPTLALHGWLDNAASFDHLAPLLPHHRIVALDMAGHGLSSRRVGAPYHFIDYVADAAAVVTSLGWTEFCVIGHSLGAGVAALLAGTWPQRVQRLVLLEGFGPLSEPDAKAPQRLREAVEAEVATRRKASLRTGYSDFEAVVQRLADATEMRPESARTLLLRGLHEVAPGRWDWRADPEIRQPSRLRLNEVQVQHFLREISCPTLLVRAVPGMVFDTGYFEQRLACVANLKVVECAGGHHVHMDDPATVAGIVAPFLAD